MEIIQEWIAQQRAVCNAATPGPWESKHYGRYEDHDECCIALPDDSIEPSKYENADFIAAARTALPAALDALEAYMQRESEKDAEIARLTAERDAAVKDITHRAWNCKNSNGCTYKSAVTGMLDCDGCNDWEWIGLCAENAPADATWNAANPKEANPNAV